LSSVAASISLEPNFEGPCILTADLDLDEIPKSKYDFDVVGHYSRPDIFRLYVNTRPTLPVVVSSEEDDWHQT
jgi:nitrilase